MQSQLYSRGSYMSTLPWRGTEAPEGWMGHRAFKIWGFCGLDSQLDTGLVDFDEDTFLDAYFCV